MRRRWTVTGWLGEGDRWCEWLASPDSRLVSGRWFPTWREAFDYADAMARSDA